MFMGKMRGIQFFLPERHSKHVTEFLRVCQICDAAPLDWKKKRTCFALFQHSFIYVIFCPRSVVLNVLRSDSLTSLRLFGPFAVALILTWTAASFFLVGGGGKSGGEHISATANSRAVADSANDGGSVWLERRALKNKKGKVVNVGRSSFAPLIGQSAWTSCRVRNVGHRSTILIGQPRPPIRLSEHFISDGIFNGRAVRLTVSTIETAGRVGFGRKKQRLQWKTEREFSGFPFKTWTSLRCRTRNCCIGQSRPFA